MNCCVDWAFRSCKRMLRDGDVVCGRTPRNVGRMASVKVLITVLHQVGNWMGYAQRVRLVYSVRMEGVEEVTNTGGGGRGSLVRCSQGDRQSS